MKRVTAEFEKVKTEVLVQYVVSETELPQALDVLHKFAFHPIATAVLRNYYAALPEAREEMACDLRVVAERQKTYLFALKTTCNQYLYLGADSDILYIGAYEQGISDREILRFLGSKIQNISNRVSPVPLKIFRLCKMKKMLPSALLVELQRENCIY